MAGQKASDETKGRYVMKLQILDIAANCAGLNRLLASFLTVRFVK